MEDRFSLMLRAKNITASKLADDIKVQRSAISHILSGRNKPSLDLLQKIFETYSDISPDWLISGKGPMFRSGEGFSTNQNHQPEPPQPQKSKAMSPGLFDIDLQPAVDKPGEISSKPDRRSERKNSDDVEKQHIEKSIDTAETILKPPIHKGSRIEKIIVFYSDKSFDEYRPA